MSLKKDLLGSWDLHFLPRLAVSYESRPPVHIDSAQGARLPLAAGEVINLLVRGYVRLDRIVVHAAYLGHVPAVVPLVVPEVVGVNDPVPAWGASGIELLLRGTHALVSRGQRAFEFFHGGLCHCLRLELEQGEGHDGVRQADERQGGVGRVEELQRAESVLLALENAGEVGWQRGERIASLRSSIILPHLLVKGSNPAFSSRKRDLAV